MPKEITIQIQGKERTVSELLKDRKYSIDYYQREYRWETKHVTELIEDLSNKFFSYYDKEHELTQVGNYGNYFLGSIVISHKEGENFIVDGQQRLTSLTLLLIYINNLQKSRTNHVNISDLIFSEVYGVKSFNIDIDERKNCMEFLYNDRKEQIDLTEAPESVRNLVNRYTDIEENFPDELKGEALPYFIWWLQEKVVMVEIIAHSDEDAYTIFETMNDRGLSLSPTDMLKGYLLANVNNTDNKDQLNELWKNRIYDLLRISKEDEIVLARGIVEKIGLSPAIMRYQVVNKNPLFLAEKKDELPPEEKTPVEIQDHGEAITCALKALTDPKKGVVRSPTEIAAVGHRVVHGGERFQESVVIDQEVLKSITACVEFAPLHNPHNLRGYYASRDLLSHCPHVAIFDTAFHQSMPRRAFLYGLPYQIYQKYGIRRYGFHGVSHRYVSYRLGQLCGTHRDYMKVITCHLGNGCSCAAIDHGKSIDTTMGFTPLEGLLMGTRCGNLDPGVVLHLMETKGYSVKDMTRILYKESGLLGVSGISQDMRALLESDEVAAKEAIELFCYRAACMIGQLTMAAGGFEALVFTGGIGEHAAPVRARIAEWLEWTGLRLHRHADLGRGRRVGVDHARREPVPVLRVDQRVIDRGDRVLPDEVLSGDLWTEVARPRAHVAMGQLEPCAGESVVEGRRILVEPFGNLAIDRVQFQRHVGIGHDRTGFAGNHMAEAEPGPAVDDQKLFGLGVVIVFAARDSWKCSEVAELSAVRGFEQFHEDASRIGMTR